MRTLLPARLALPTHTPQYHRSLSPPPLSPADGEVRQLRRLTLHTTIPTTSCYSSTSTPLPMHTIDNKVADMELHLVHADANSRLLVVGFMIHADDKEEAEEEERKKRGVTTSNSALDFLNALLWSHLPTTSTFHTQSASPSTSPTSPSSSSPLLYHLQSALSSTSTSSPLFYHYPGSLTTPPCTEGVQWFVHTSLLHISRSQLSAYARLFPDTSRPVQPLNGRQVQVVGGVAVDEAAGGVGTMAVVLFFSVVVVAVLLVWYWQHSHAHHTLGEMMDASLQLNAERDKQADVQWRRDRDIKTSFHCSSHTRRRHTAAATSHSRRGGGHCTAVHIADEQGDASLVGQSERVERVSVWAL